MTKTSFRVSTISPSPIPYRTLTVLTRESLYRAAPYTALPPCLPTPSAFTQEGAPSLNQPQLRARALTHGAHLQLFSLCFTHRRSSLTYTILTKLTRVQLLGWLRISAWATWQVYLRALESGRLLGRGCIQKVNDRRLRTTSAKLQERSYSGRKNGHGSSLAPSEGFGIRISTDSRQAV